MIELSQDQIDRFNEDGFLFVDNLLDEESVEEIKRHYELMFRGEFETGIRPDEVNWQESTGDPSLTRQICNGWKGDRAIARVVLREDIGRACATLGGWPGARIKVDNVLWKPPGTRPLGMHQDSAYLGWINPSDMISCWIALDDTSAESGTMELVRGSHKWRHSEPEGEFHGPEDYQRYMRQAAAAEGIDEQRLSPLWPRKAVDHSIMAGPGTDPGSIKQLFRAARWSPTAFRRSRSTCRKTSAPVPARCTAATCVTVTA